MTEPYQMDDIYDKTVEKEKYEELQKENEYLKSILKFHINE